MPVTISIRFLTGRAHLHPWGTHHSEGRVEWPPSPWRLLRAIVAVAGRGLTTLPAPDFVHQPQAVDSRRRTRAKVSRSSSAPATGIDYWQDQTTDEVCLSRLTGLLARLVPLPTIWLPQTSGGHTRHFFPIHEAGVVKTAPSATFDTFVVVRKDQPLVFHWPDASLDNQALVDLSLILARMTYFGRAESWCRAEVSGHRPQAMLGVEPGKTHWECVCIEDGRQPTGQEYREYTLERRLAALPIQSADPADLTETVALQAVRLLPKTKPVFPDGRPKKDEEFRSLLEREHRERPETLLLRCLLRESGQDIRDGLERPIGTRWVHYAVPRAVYELPRPARRSRPRTNEAVDLVRYALNTATVHRPVLPPLTDTLLVADRFRSAVWAIYRNNQENQNTPHPRMLLGKDADGNIGRDHRHAFWWPTDEDNDGLIDQVTVYAPGGFDHHEVDALRRLLRLRQRGGRPDLLVTPTFVGRAAEFGPWREKDANGNDRRVCLFVSATPYFCPLDLSHGRTGGSRMRPVTRVIREGLRRQGLIRDPGEVEIHELVFDYDPEELQTVRNAVAAGERQEPVPPRQYFPVIEPPVTFPPLPHATTCHLPAFPRASLKNPDAGHPFGLAVGLFVDQGTRFIRALSFRRNRRGHQVKGHGRMLLIQFREARRPEPFALGAQCHFGFGLFVPAQM